jgi:hypothetical protein
MDLNIVSFIKEFGPFTQISIAQEETRAEQKRYLSGPNPMKWEFR